MHLRTLLGTRFDEKCFDTYRQDIINESISILQFSTREHVAEISDVNIPEQQEEMNDNFLLQTETSEKFSQELFSEIKIRLVNALLSLKENENILFESFGDLGRIDYADEFMGRVIETEKQRWDIDDMRMNENCGNGK